eukprot:16440497-Heterocapsa_arctica.AAC.1
MRRWGHLAPRMILRKLQAPGYLWKTQDQAAEAVWLEAAQSRDKHEQSLPYHLGISSAWGVPRALENRLFDSFSAQKRAPQQFPSPSHLGGGFFNIDGEIPHMDWIRRAACEADPDPDLWANLRLGNCVTAWESSRHCQEALGCDSDPDGDVDMGWDCFHNDPERRNWDLSNRTSEGSQLQNRRIIRGRIIWFLFLPSIFLGTAAAAQSGKLSGNGRLQYSVRRNWQPPGTLAPEFLSCG